MFRLIKSFESPLSGYVDAQSVGALGEKLFLERVVPELCKDSDVAVRNLTTLGSSFTYAQYPLCRLFEGKVVECLNANQVVTVPRGVSELGIDIYVGIDFGASIAMKSGARIVERTLQVPTPSTILERLANSIKEGLRSVANELCSYAMERMVRRALLVEELDLLGIHFDFVCAKSDAVSRCLSLEVTIRLCTSPRSLLDASSCLDTHRCRMRIHVPIMTLSNARVFEVKTSLKYSRIDRSSLKGLFHFKSLKDAELYFSNVREVLKKYGARYYLVLVSPKPIHQKALVSIYELQ